jgi:H+/Cl- antiporter ClcA
MNTNKTHIGLFEKITVFFKELPRQIGIWIVLGVAIGIPIGLVSAFFLYALDYVTHIREANYWLIALLPLAGLSIAYLYHRAGKETQKGNNLLFDEYFIPQKPLPFIMAPLILLTTLLTHLVGGSSGREGTAVQMGAVIADRFEKWSSKFKVNRSMLIMVGMGAGFAALFGTPWAGTIFAIEILRNKETRFDAIVPALVTSFVAYYTCVFTHAPHTHYDAVSSVTFSFINLPYLFGAAACFGLCAWLYIQTHHIFSSVANRLFTNAIWRPFFGGILLFIIFLAIGDARFLGLGIPTILDAFETQLPYFDFIIKLLLTALTLAVGFKGGEVTPLFFIGAALGNVLALFVPLPLAFMAALGFIGVFAGATKTFLACSIMGVELFGWDALPYFVLVCLVAQLFSGKKSIYSSQPSNRLAFF